MPHAPCRSTFQLGAVALALIVAPPAAAEPPVRVDLFVAAPADVAGRIEAAVTLPDVLPRWTRVSRIDPQAVLRLGPAITPEPSGETVWVEASRPDVVQLYFANPGADRFLVRDVPLPMGLDEPALESLAQVIESSVGALLADARTGMSRAQMTTALAQRAAPPPPPEPAPTWRAGGGAFYAARILDDDGHVEQGPGAIAGVQRTGARWGYGGWLSADYLAPLTVERWAVGVRREGFGVRAGVEIARALGPGLRVSWRGGAGVDVVSVSPRPGLSPTLPALEPAVVDVDAVAQLAVGASVHVLADLELLGAVLADIDLLRHPDDVSIGAGRIRVLTPWWVRPVVLLGLAWQ